MERFTDTQEFAFSNIIEYINLAVKTNGGSIQLAIWDGEAWIDDDVISTDGKHKVETKNLRIKFTPSGGATYSLALGD